MSARQYLSYTYLIGWSRLDLWYYGVRYAQVKRKQDYDLWVNYFTHSVPVKQMRAFVGEPDVIHYDKIFDSIDEAKFYELKVLNEHNCKNSIHWLNKNDIPAPPVISGRNHPMYGKKHSENTKKILREKALKRNPISEETRLKISQANKGKGRPHTKESIEKMKKSALRRLPISKETRSKMSKSQKGRHHKEETKLKLRKKNGRKIKIDGVVYQSFKEAANSYGLTRTAMYRWIKNGKATAI